MIGKYDNSNTSFAKTFPRNVILAAIGAIMISVMVSCSDTKSTDPSTEEALVTNNANESASKNTNTVKASKETSIAEGKPVYYDVNNWTVKKSDTAYTLKDLSKMQRIFGKVTSTDKNSLDYASNTAIKYRFMTGTEPYLDIIDSQYYLEVGWYYANPNDSKEEKEMSIAHAKKVYQLAHNLMGDAGGELVSSILTGQIIKNKSVGDKHVELAKCEFYSCMVILRKG